MNPLRIEDRPAVIWVCPQTIKLNGITLLKTLITIKANQTAIWVGNCLLVINTMEMRTIAASVERSATIVSGGSSSSETSTRKKDPPHNIDRVINIDHSVSPICCALSDMLLFSMTAEPLL